MPLVQNPYSTTHTIGNGPVVDGGGTVEVSDEEAESLIAQGWRVGIAITDESPVVVAPKGRRADAPEVPEVTSADPEPAESGDQEEN